MADRGMRIRLERLEAAQPGVTGIWHRVVVRPGQTDEEALDLYGRERIAVADHVILRRIVNSTLSHA